jgi:IclR family mhp operon transcriptional activator
MELQHMEKGVPIRAVSRSISVLQTINRYGSISMMGIARRELLPYPTACRIVQTLLHEGLIEQEPTRKHYRPTVLVQSLAQGFKTGSQLISVARPHIKQLTREIGWPVFISVRAGAHMVVRESTHAETSLTYGDCHPGQTIPLVQSATGQVYLASLPESEFEDLMRWVEFADEENAAKINIDELTETLDAIRMRGFAAKECMNGLPERSSSIAVPIFRSDRIEAILTLCYFYKALKESVAIERYLEKINHTARAISKDLDQVTN